MERNRVGVCIHTYAYITIYAKRLLLSARTVIPARASPSAQIFKVDRAARDRVSRRGLFSFFPFFYFSHVVSVALI